MAVPYGDPGGMRTLAGILRAKADACPDIVRGLQSGTYGLRAQGNCFKRLRRRVNGHLKAAEGIRDSLLQLAQLLEQEASHVENEIAAANRHNAMVEQRKRDAIQRARSKQ